MNSTNPSLTFRHVVIQYYGDAGVERCIIWLPTAPEEEMLSRLDRYAKLATSFS